ncbi:ribosomal RNA large subunit methyltransferase F [Nonlabens ulvanivorans]|nr:23S rRNA (adenine(1618)-N(6))-methyltransferase RlmF [Nonlabens ulvanivorans]GAK89728.1 ribosomal RNA large subunit methyltransferase F [Nonlabens ulvanivorans]
MHDNNLHKHGYDLDLLSDSYPDLKPHFITKEDGLISIDFTNPASVLALNSALLKEHYGVNDWELPLDYLSPPIPSRVDYILHIADLVGEKNKTGLDIGAGANMIYPILGTAMFNWKMVGSEVDPDSYEFATALQNKISLPKSRKISNIKLRLQEDRGAILKNIIKPQELYDFTMCNPPFYSSEDEAIKANQRKNKNLGNEVSDRNFAGKSHELWCNGGEALFVKRLIKESVAFKAQVGWFTSLISRKENLPKLEKQLTKLKATYKIVPMNSGNKKSRFIAWQFEK